MYQKQNMSNHWALRYSRGHWTGAGGVAINNYLLRAICQQVLHPVSYLVAKSDGFEFTNAFVVVIIIINLIKGLLKSRKTASISFPSSSLNWCSIYSRRCEYWVELSVQHFHFLSLVSDQSISFPQTPIPQLSALLFLRHDQNFFPTQPGFSSSVRRFSTEIMFSLELELALTFQLFVLAWNGVSSIFNIVWFKNDQWLTD